MGLYSPRDGIQRVAEQLGSNIKNTARRRVTPEVRRRIMRYLETITVTESVRIRVGRLTVRRYYTGDPDDPRPEDIIIGRWFTTPAPVLDGFILELDNVIFTLDGVANFVD